MKLLWQQIPAPQITTIYCQSHFDGIVFDDEHGSFNSETLFSLIQICKGFKKTCFVRFSNLDKTKSRHVLDAGVDGLIFSTVNDEDQANSILEWCRYSPRGKRGQGLVAENGWGKYPEKFQCREPLVIAQIEDARGLAKIAGKFDFDYFMLGPYDLSADLGCIADWNNPKYKNAIQFFNTRVTIAKRWVHLVSNIHEEYPKYKDFDTVALGMDTTFLLNQINLIENELLCSAD